jgi:glutamine cyclotransferase
MKNKRIEIYITNGSNKVFILNNNFKIQSIVEIKFYNGTAVNNLNELEFTNDLLYANIYLTNFIVAINLESGFV